MTNQNNHPNNDMQAVRGLGQLPNAPTTLPTLTNQNNELRASIYSILLDVGVKKSNVSAVTDSIIQALYAPKPVTLKDIASPNMTPEASKVVSDAIERSAEVMNKVAKPVENGELESLLHINGCQQRTAGYNEAKQGADGMDTDDMERQNERTRESPCRKKRAA